MAVRRAANAGLRAVQIFTAIPKYYGDKSTIRAERVERFHAALDETGIRAEHVLVHAAYVLNLAITDAEKWGRARDGIAKELERSTMLGVGGACFHPGSATDSEAAGIRRIAQALTDFTGGALALGTYPELAVSIDDDVVHGVAVTCTVFRFIAVDGQDAPRADHGAGSSGRSGA